MCIINEICDKLHWVKIYFKKNTFLCFLSQNYNFCNIRSMSVISNIFANPVLDTRISVMLVVPHPFGACHHL